MRFHRQSRLFPSMYRLGRKQAYDGAFLSERANRRAHPDVTPLNPG